MNQLCSTRINLIKVGLICDYMYFTEGLHKKRPSFSKKKVDSEYYTTNEIAEKYHIRRKTILARCERFNIPKVYEGRKMALVSINLSLTGR